MGLSEKTKAWLKDNCRVSLRGKTALITGADSGVGFQTAEILLQLDACVVLVCRNMEKAASAQEKLQWDHPGASVSVMKLDLADFRSVEAFSDELRAKGTDVDILVNNAGVFHQPGRKTADGFELVMGTNYIGTFYLTERILPYLECLPHEVVVINTVSIVCRIAGIPDFRKFYDGGNLAVYARSKLCLAIYTRELARRTRKTRLRILMSHPGITMTPLGMNAYGKTVSRLAGRFRGVFNSPEKSALSAAYILSHEVPPGALVGPDRFFGGWGFPRENKIPRRADRNAEELIRFTEKEIARAGGKIP